MVGQSGNRRLVRVAESIRSEVSRLLLRQVSDPRLAWVTVTDVEVSPDLRHAKVFYVVTKAPDGNVDERTVAASLKKAATFLQGEMGRKLNLKYTPHLNFIFDKSFDEAAHIDALLGEVAHETEEAPPLTPEQQLGRLVSESTDILVLTHRNPDGDAAGSLLGFSRMLRLMGKTPTVFCPDGVPKVLRYLDGVDEVVDHIESDEQFELTVSLDTADSALWPDGVPAQSQMGTLVVIDHHDTHKPFGDVVIRWKASAVGEMLLGLQKALVWPIDAEVAMCLYTSIVADTGSFRYSNTTPETHEAAAELIALGAKSWVVATALFESYPAARQRLLGAVLGTLQTAHDDQYAYLHCTMEMLEKTGADKADLDNVINFARGIDTVQVAAMYRQEKSGDVKVSFRSKGDYDVAAIAATFGGGGHKNAAGCTLTQTTISSAIDRVGEAISSMFVR